MQRHGTGPGRPRRASRVPAAAPRTGMLRAAGVALLTLLLSSCLATPIDAGRPTRVDASRLPPCRESLAAFTDFEIAPFRQAKAIQADPDKLATTAELEARVKERLTPLFSRWQAERAAQQPRRKLVVQPFVLRLRVVGTVNRVFSGGYAGDSFIEMNLEVRDADADMLLCAAEVRSGADGATGLWSAGSTDRGVVDTVVETTYRYFARQNLLD